MGEQVVMNFGSVMLDEGKFVIDADVDEPKFVNILCGSLSVRITLSLTRLSNLEPTLRSVHTVHGCMIYSQCLNLGNMLNSLIAGDKARST